MDIENQSEVERKAKLGALKNYVLSDNYKSLEKEVESIKEKTKATLITAYLSPSAEVDEDGMSVFSEKKKYNHKNKFAWGIETMSDMIALIDESEGGKIVKERIQEGIDNSEEHIAFGLIKNFPGSGMCEFRYTDIEFTASDRISYKAQVAADTLKLIDTLIQEATKTPEVDEEVIED